MPSLFRFLAVAPFLLIGLLIGTAGPVLAETLRIGMTQFPANFNPNIESMLAREMVLSATRRPVTAHDQDWKAVCFLCVELPTLENGLAKVEELPDGGKGMALTYRIQPGATWGDGTPVTSKDAVFTWEVGSHEKAGFSNSELYRRILSVDAVDEKTFTLHVDRMPFDYSYAFTHDFDLLPEHIERPIFEENPDEYRNRTAYNSDTTNPGLSFGPYRIAEIVPGSEIVIVPNETWWGEPPQFDRVVFKVIENTAALEANLLSGAIDVISGELGLTLDQALAFERRHGDNYNILYKPGLIYEHIDLNLDSSLLSDIRMRRALIHALDRDAISKQLFKGRQPVAHGSVNPQDPMFYKGLPRYDFDPEKSKALLDELGWSEMKDRFRHNAAGERLTIEFMTTAGNRSRELVQQALQSQWRSLGIDVRIKNEPARVFFGQTVSKRRFTGMVMFAWVSTPESVPRTTLHSDQIPSTKNNWAGQNYTGFNNPEMDELLEAIDLELDEEKRRALWQRQQVLYAEELPVIPLYWRASAFVLPKWLKGVRPTGHQQTTTLWIEEWYRDGS